MAPRRGAREGTKRETSLITDPRSAAAVLTVIVLTLNEEANLPACIASLWGLKCELHVLDSGSTDRTVAIARAGGASVSSHPFENYGAQRNWAQRELPIESEWVLHLDADERLTPELVDEIGRVLINPPAIVNGFLLRKRTMFMGRWIKHGGQYPAYHLRLFRKNSGSCEDRLYDQHFLVEGRVDRLEHDYIDVLTADIRTWTVRHARWAELEATEMQAPTGGPGRVRGLMLGSPIERKRWLRETPYRAAPLFIRAFLYWFYRYVLRLGFLDGSEGMIFHFLQGFWYRFLIDVKMYEHQQKLRLDPRRAAEV
jgi:glycosyltransferase involved in cell wall biosynthesis